METRKKAFIVGLAPMTRIVLDAAGKTREEIEDEAIRLAIGKMLHNPSDYICYGNVDLLEDDMECQASQDEELTPNY